MSAAVATRSSQQPNPSLTAAAAAAAAAPSAAIPASTSASRMGAQSPADTKKKSITTSDG
ncbi:MAG: hypothetical protein M1832_004754 [Thelocarpon impressellum]|nr:MAG: hypothetical protein M1832_004754 [Thelocarpon impressellum]